MVSNHVFEAMQLRFKANLKTRVVAFGSSNTQHIYPGMHWFDVFKMAIWNTYGHKLYCIDSGICGNTAYDLLERFDEDAALYQPHLVFITIGCNDGMRGTSETGFLSNLYELHRRFTEKKCMVVFQTYYSINPASGTDASPFYRFMDIVREVAISTESGLVDNLIRWDLLRKVHPEIYLKMMHDEFHVNCYGNMLIGLDAARHFGATVDRASDPPGYWDETLKIQGIIDELEKQ